MRHSDSSFPCHSHRFVIVLLSSVSTYSSYPPIRLTKARRRSAHLLQRPQWRPSLGTMQENVSSSGSPRPNSQDVLLSPAGRRGAGCSRGCPWLDPCPLEVTEELVGGVGERVAGQGGQGQLPDAVHGAPDRRFDAEQGVSARQVDGAVGAVGVGRVAAVDAPMRRRTGPPAADREPPVPPAAARPRPAKTPAAPTTRPAPRPVRRGRRTAARRGLAAAGAPAGCSYPVRRWQARRSVESVDGEVMVSAPGDGCRQAPSRKSMKDRGLGSTPGRIRTCNRRIRNRGLPQSHKSLSMRILQCYLVLCKDLRSPTSSSSLPAYSARMG